jgi:multidrug efflux pump subunit AcrA (membrane-fusion protein)
MNKLIMIALLALASFANAKTLYQCPMHPQIIREQPGQCPICHMTLEKIEDHEHGTGAGGQRAAFSLPAARQQLIGVKTVVAARGPLTKTLRLSGRVSGGGVVAQLMEMDAGLVKAGQHATLRGPGGQTAHATVSGVEGSLDSLTRSFGVFVSPTQNAPWLRSGVYCEAQVDVPLGAGISLPADAVLITGDQAVVFVRLDKERFEPRSVELGHQDDAWIEVTKGLKAGEEVVTGANFLIDSEARFKAAIDAYAAPAGGKP